MAAISARPPPPNNIMPCNGEVHGMHADTTPSTNNKIIQRPTQRY